MAVVTADFSGYVAYDYVDEGYAEDNSLIVRSSITASANIPAPIEGIFTYYVLADYVATDYIEGEPLAASASLTTSGGYLLTGAVTSSVNSTLLVQGGFSQSGELNIGAISSLTAQGNHIFSAEPGTVYVDPDYVDPDYIETGLRVLCALTTQADIIGADVVVTLSAAFGVSAQLSRIVSVEDLAYPAYTWADTDPLSWDDWPDNIWGAEGITCQVRSSINIVPSMINVGTSAMSVAFTQQAVGNHIFAGQPIISTAASLTAIGNHIFDGQSTMLAEFTAQGTGNYILFGDPVIAAVFNVPDIFGGIVSVGQAVLAAAFNQAIDQSGVNGTAGIVFNAASLMATPAELILDQSGLNGTAGIFFRAVPEVFVTEFTSTQTGVFIYRDPYRFLRVPRETRVLVVPPRETLEIAAQTRIIPVFEEIRTIKVPKETRVLIEGIAEYENFRRRKV